MIRSMTGFGSAETDLLGQQLSAQIQSVNHRYCEISVRMPRSLGQHESALRARLTKRFSRGKLNLQINWEGREEQNRSMRLDRDKIRSYFHELDEVQTELRLSGALDIQSILALPDIWTQDVEGPDDEQIQNALVELVESAADDLISMREREGQELHKEFETRLQRIAELNEKSSERNDDRPAALKERLLERLQPLLEGVEVDPNRLAQEAALLADRLDYTEECVRLRAHIEQFRDLLAGKEPVGRKMNFLLQEMNREANTMGSKANDAEIAAVVVELKDEMEKLREQVQNVE